MVASGILDIVLDAVVDIDGVEDKKNDVEDDENEVEDNNKDVGDDEDKDPVHDRLVDVTVTVTVTTCIGLVVFQLKLCPDGPG